MAQIVLHNDELIKLISGFVSKNQRISEVSAERSKIKIKIKTPGILPSATIILEFDRFAQNKAFFRLQANPLIKLIIDFFEMPGLDWLHITASEISVDVNKVLKSKVSNLRITDIRQPAPDQYLVDLEIL